MLYVLAGGFPGGISGKEPVCQCRRHKRRGLHPTIGTIPWRRAQEPTPVLLPGESQDRGTWRVTVYSATTEVTQRTHVHVKRRTFKDLISVNQSQIIQLCQRRRKLPLLLILMPFLTIICFCFCFWYSDQE